MATAYLTAHPPAISQWYDERNRPLTGCTVLHSAENAFDEIGADTGAEGVAEFCRTRTTYGSYHDIVDSDTEIYLVDYDHGAYHDGTGSNNWALSLSFACRTTDWRRMSPEKRKAMLRNGAKAFLRQQAYRESVGAPLTELRLITKAQSDAGVSGFTYHGWRDPGRRTDPGTIAPDLFPIDEFIAEIRALQSGEEDDMTPEQDKMLRYIYEHATIGTAGVKRHGKQFEALIAGSITPGKAGEWNMSWGYKTLVTMMNELTALRTTITEMAKAGVGGNLDVNALMAQIEEKLESIQIRVDVPESPPA